ncbi:MAG TPA: signal peptidase II [Gammaproteobacteria bacterium]|nr:signal peptidase II [Gammaproteobacteria bacterium]
MLRLKYWHWILLSVFVVILDQSSKWVASTYLQYHIPVEVTPFFNWYLDFNHGAAWNFLSNETGWQRWVLAGFSTLVSILILFWLRDSENKKNTSCAGLALILGGAVGNLVDRIYPGVVTDFIQWHLSTYYWPTFNIADSAVCVGAVLYIWGMRND